MTRIIIPLACLAMILAVTATIIGISIGDLHEKIALAKQDSKSQAGATESAARSDLEETLRWATLHRLMGVAASLAVVLVNSIVVTYFIGTSRWCKEVSETYRLDRSLLDRANQLKRRTFPWAVTGMLTVVAISSLGGAADPATLHAGTEHWVTWHLIGAFGGLALVGWSFFMEWQNISENHVVIADVLADVQRIRAERGLEV